jgi:hypothetical protein
MLRKLRRALRRRAARGPGAEASRVGRTLIRSQAFLSPCATQGAELATPRLRVRLPLSAT